MRRCCFDPPVFVPSASSSLSACLTTVRLVAPVSLSTASLPSNSQNIVYVVQPTRAEQLPVCSVSFNSTKLPLIVDFSCSQHPHPTPNVVPPRLYIFVPHVVPPPLLSGTHACWCSSAPSYRIEVFAASSTVSESGSKFGQSEVQTVTLATDGVAEGTFTLAFGELDNPLPGTVDVVNGDDFVVTSEDLTPYIKRGDRVAFEGGWEYAVHAFMPFNASHLYLAQVQGMTTLVAVV